MLENKNEIKISFLGDIMCEKPFLKSWKNQTNNQNVFNELYFHLEDTFAESDYIVGNLETVCAGEELNYTNHIFNFNTPDEFIKSIKQSGIDLVTTATNHSLDRGVEGLIKNLDTLERYSLKNIGTYSTAEAKKELFVEEIKGLKIAFLNYTFGTNAHINEVVLKEEELNYINLLKPQAEEIERMNNKKKPKSLKQKIANTVFKFISLEQWIKIKKRLGLEYNKAYEDNNLHGIDLSYLEDLKKDIENAKKSSDIVIMCMHSGGQFNSKPGKYTEYMMDFMSDNGVDVVIGNHPHVVQKYEEKESGMLAAYSLGNFSISPSSVYVLHENLPDYSVMFHLYYDSQTKEITKKTFSILKIVEREDNSLEVYPLAKLLDKVTSKKETDEIISNATKIYNRFLNTNEEKIQIKREYLI